MAGDIKSIICQKLQLKERRVYCLGIGGVGVSALAELLKLAGCEVAGSDLTYNEYCRHLEDIGVAVAPQGHRESNVPTEKFDAVIVSGAVGFSNPEVSLLLRRDCAMNWERGEALGELSRCFKRTVSVAGAHGKSSVTAMLGWILRQTGVDAGLLIGASYSDDSPRVTLGNGDILVTEADENYHSLPMLQGELALITNIDGDHAWTAEALEQQEREFRMFCRTHRHQIAIESENTRRVLGDVDTVQYLGKKELAQLDALVPERFLDYERINAALAIAGAMHLNVEGSQAGAALASYPGINRRQTLLLETDKLQVWEDYAHHPAELSASLQVLKKRAGSRRLLVIFEPHRFERLNKYFDLFADILSDPAVDVMLMDVFSAWQVEKLDVRDSADLAAAVNKLGGNAQLLQGTAESMAVKVQQELAQSSSPRAAAFIGAGNVHETVKKFTALIKSGNG